MRISGWSTEVCASVLPAWHIRSSPAGGVRVARLRGTAARATRTPGALRRAGGAKRGGGVRVRQVAARSREAAAERRKVKSTLMRRFAPPSPAGGRRVGSLLGRRRLALEQHEQRNPHRPTPDRRNDDVEHGPVVVAPATREE